MFGINKIFFSSRSLCIRNCVNNLQAIRKLVFYTKFSRRHRCNKEGEKESEKNRRYSRQKKREKRKQYEKGLDSYGYTRCRAAYILIVQIDWTKCRVRGGTQIYVKKHYAGIK